METAKGWQIAASKSQLRKSGRRAPSNKNSHNSIPVDLYVVSTDEVAFLVENPPKMILILMPMPIQTPAL
jgi:hypothetical protein